LPGKSDSRCARPDSGSSGLFAPGFGLSPPSSRLHSRRGPRFGVPCLLSPLYSALHAEPPIPPELGRVPAPRVSFGLQRAQSQWSMLFRRSRGSPWDSRESGEVPIRCWRPGNTTGLNTSGGRKWLFRRDCVVCLFAPLALISDPEQQSPHETRNCRCHVQAKSSECCVVSLWGCQ
jgi:hypothetical protein